MHLGCVVDDEARCRVGEIPGQEGPHMYDAHWIVPFRRTQFQFLTYWRSLQVRCIKPWRRFYRSINLYKDSGLRTEP